MDTLINRILSWVPWFNTTTEEEENENINMGSRTRFGRSHTTPRGRSLVAFESVFGGSYDPYNLPNYWHIYGTGIDGRAVDRRKPELEPKLRDDEILKVNWIDFKCQQNAKEHNTDKFEVTNYYYTDDGERKQPQLVVRRGQAFTMELQMSKEFKPVEADLRIIFELGRLPKPGKGTSVNILVSDRDIKGEWGAKITSVQGNTLTVSVIIPPDCLIGKWEMKVDSVMKLRDDSERNYRYLHSNPVYILFNPWCKEDGVYMENEMWRDEYILNDVGKIYAGNYKQIGAKPWNFGQFEDFMLDVCMFLIDRTNLKMEARGNPVQIARKISAIVNSLDDNGVLVGNWSGNYEGGTKPTKWVGSVAILAEYWKTKRPVKFGQCWVFSGVVTTVCRCLGIPARSVTNFASAHDSDGSITIDKHWDVDGTPLDDMDEDSIWNFHVWNDVWMARPDLPAGCGGWQAIDATPQETSEGVFCAGPASMAAIKGGQVHLPYDGAFIFAEVNADRINWCRKQDGTWQKVPERRLVGKKISTKLPNGVPRSSLSRWRTKEDPDREDITDSYKFPEGTPEERSAVLAANTRSTKPDAYEKGPEDVDFAIDDKDHIMAGSQFEVTLKMSNNSDEVRTINIRLGCGAVYYTGVLKAKIKSQSFSVELPPKEKVREVTMTVSPDDYLNEMVDQCAFKSTVMAKVAETNQIFCAYDDFRLRRPDVEIEGPENGKVGQSTEFRATVENPLPRTLTRCEFTIEGAGLQRAVNYVHNDVDPGQKAVLVFKVTPTKPGPRQVMVSFDCKELPDICGSHTMDVSS